MELSKKLYFDTRLSKSGFISCNSCHNLSMAGTDNLTTSIGHNWRQDPIANPGEMAFTHELAVGVFNSIPAYKAEFKKVFGKDTATLDMVTHAIAAFEATLVTPDSRFDKWLQGDKKTLTGKQPDFKLPILPPSTNDTPRPKPFG